MEEEVSLSLKRKRVGPSEERICSPDNQEQSSGFPQIEADLLDIIQAPKIWFTIYQHVFILHTGIEDDFDQVLEELETKSRLEKYNIFCLFDVEYHYTNQLFAKLSTDQMDMIKNKWIMVSLFCLLK
ncbi:hypothetical protein Glove_481g34 [Diversispora epigaea]|uniref:Uncharacterized protein n=1 Tax=Diversispora epigaea TaxID=1348612 RepID=A0A397GP11_9GLOM|nr:hypothetical protein Glove_481g34 [Diversispora epigaea]